MGNNSVDGLSGMTVRAVLDRFLPSPRGKNPNTRRAYATALHKIADRIGADRPLAAITPGEPAGALEEVWGQTGRRLEPAPRGHRFLPRLVRENSTPAPTLPASAERRPEHADQTRPSPTPRSSGC